ncbi:MAG: cation transporter [Burkholderiales bacterium]
MAPGRRHSRLRKKPFDPEVARSLCLAFDCGRDCDDQSQSACVLAHGLGGLLSDALESLVNLVAGCAALIALIIAARSADDDHQFGHEKAEYFSSGFEGALILLVLYPANNLFMSAPFVVSLSNHERRSFALRLAQGERQLM